MNNSNGLKYLNLIGFQYKFLPETTTKNASSTQNDTNTIEQPNIFGKREIEGVGEKTIETKHIQFAYDNETL